LASNSSSAKLRFEAKAKNNTPRSRSEAEHVNTPRSTPERHAARRSTVAAGSKRPRNRKQPAAFSKNAQNPQNSFFGHTNLQTPRAPSVPNRSRSFELIKEQKASIRNSSYKRHSPVESRNRKRERDSYPVMCPMLMIPICCCSCPKRNGRKCPFFHMRTHTHTAKWPGPRCSRRSKTRKGSPWVSIHMAKKESKRNGRKK